MKNFENLNLSLEQEIKHEDTLVNNLNFPDGVEDIRDIFSQYEELAENSNNNRTVPIISKCSKVMSEGFLCDEYKDEIERGVAYKLFPILYNNILENKEKAKAEDLFEMFSNIHDTNSSLLKKMSENLLFLVDPNTKENFKQLVYERTDRK